MKPFGVFEDEDELNHRWESMACDVVDHIINTIFQMYLNLNGRNNVNVIDVFDF